MKPKKLSRKGGAGLPREQAKLKEKGTRSRTQYQLHLQNSSNKVNHQKIKVVVSFLINNRSK
jgi:hypothetical protein